MAVIRLYCDESGKFPDHRVVSFCAAVSYAEEWTRLERLWQAKVKDSDLSYLKMAEALSFKKAFENWMLKLSQQDRVNLRDTLIDYLAKQVGKYIKGYMSSPITKADFDALPSERRLALRDPVFMAFEATMRSIRPLLESRELRNDGVHIVYDSSKEYSPKCLSMYHDLRDIQSLGSCSNLSHSQTKGIV